MTDTLVSSTQTVRLRAPALLALYAFAGFISVRLILAARVGSVSFPDAPAVFLKAFALGLYSDVAVALILAMVLRAPFALLSRFGRRSWVRKLGHAFFVAMAGVIAFGWVAEIFFWEEFDSRFNGVAVSYLIFPREVIGNLEESFQVSLYLPLFALFAAAYWWFVRRRLAKVLSYRDGTGTRLKRLGAAVALGGLGVAMLYAEPGVLLKNRELDQLARNGLQTMASAALTNDAEYDGVFPGMPRDQALQVLRAMVGQDNTTFIEAPGTSPVMRRVVNGPDEKRLNIVMVTEETYGSGFVDSLDNPLDVPLSPELDRLAAEGLFFTNIYAQGDRTVRGLEATETGFAAIPGISTARRPGSDGMMSLAHLLNQRDYETGILYGGRNTFDNMGNFWRGIDYTNVWDQRDIRHESFSTIWGVSDEDLFTEALRRVDEMTAKGSPAFLTLMTVSNHRPYKFPQTNVKWDDRVGNIENTARYAQWAFADFVERARAKPWFKDTVFVFVADHSVKINGAARVPVNSFRIPMLFYSPANIPPQKVETLGAQIDLIPTLLGVLGFSYDSPFFGRDLMRVPKDGGHFAIAHNFSVAFGRPGHVVVLQPNGRVEGYTFSLDTKTLTPEDPDATTLEMAIAQTQEAHRAFYTGQYRWR